MQMFTRFCLTIAVVMLTLGSLRAEEPAFTRTEDVIYGRKFGTVLTFDVLKPKEKANKAAIIWVVSGGWFSSHESIKPENLAEFLKRGYTVFAVVHGSQPKYTIPEAVADLQLAVRFIRMHAADYGIDPDHIGISGGSAGGHLSLMQGMAGDKGNPDAKDPVLKVSSRVQAVACFYAPTDFLNYGKPGEIALGRGVLSIVKAPFGFQELNPETKSFELITDEAKIQEIGRQISPINHVSSDDPPTLIIHGDADKIVPIQQAESFLDKLKGAGVATELVVRPGAVHGWPNQINDYAIFADWFDKHLLERR